MTRSQLFGNQDIAYEDVTDLKVQLEEHSARIAVIGQGYVGLLLTIAFAQVGFSVTGIDTDPARVQALSQARSPIGDVNSATLRTLLTAGRYQATTDMECLAASDAIIICVPTPLRKSKDPDVSFVLAATAEVKRYLRPGQLVILESTTYPGTTEELLLLMFAEGGCRWGRTSFWPSHPNASIRAMPTLACATSPRLSAGSLPSARPWPPCSMGK